MTKINQAEMVEIPVVNETEKKFYFGDIPNLEDRNISYLYSLDWILFTGSKTPSGYNVIDVETWVSFINLFNTEGILVIDNYPIHFFQYFWNFSIPLNHIIDWQKSYIINVGNKTAGNAYCLSVLCSKKILNWQYFCKRIDLEITDTDNKRFYFNTAHLLIGKQIDFIVTDINATISPLTGKTAINSTARKQALVTFARKKSNMKDTITFPYLSLNHYYSQKKELFNDLYIDIENSFIEFPSTADLVANQIVPFYFFWRKKR